MGGNLTFNDNDDVQLKGATDATLIGNVSDALKVAMPDTAPATQTITAQDLVTISLVGANGQTFYFGTPSANSAATFSLSSVETVNVQASLLGGGGTLAVEVSTDGGTFWFRPNAFQFATQFYTNSFTSPFSAALNVTGMTHVRVRAISAWTGTATILVRESVNSHAMAITEALPSGANTLGSIANISGTISLPTGASTAANQATIITSVQILDDVPTAQNGALVKGVPIMGQLDDTGTTAATEDAIATARITAQRALHTNLRNNAGTEIATSTTPLRTDPTGTTTQPISAVSLPLPAGAATSANQSSEITLLTSIDGGIPAALGQTTMSASMPVVFPSDQIISAAPGASTIATYSAAITSFTTATLATDIFTLSGSASMVVRVTAVAVSANGSAGADVNLALLKRSTANTGGTSTTPAVIPHDSNDAAGTAVARAYTVNPTVLGTSLGTLRNAEQFVSGVTTSGSGLVQWDFGVRPAQPIVLRGTSQLLCVNLAGVTVTGGAYNIWVEWTESST